MRLAKSLSVLSLCFLVTACGGSGVPQFNADGDSVVRDKNHIDLSETALSAGDEALSLGKYNVAAQMYGKAWSSKPTAETAIRYGHALRLSGDYERGVIVMKVASKRYPGNIDILNELGRDALSGGFQDTAREAFEKAIATGHPNWETYMSYGAYYARENNIEQAKAMFRQAEAMSDSDFRKYSALSNIAIADIQGGNKTLGFQELKEVASEPGVDPKVHANMALMFGITGDTNDFRTQARKANIPDSDIMSIEAWLLGENPSESGNNGSGNSPITDSKGRLASNVNENIIRRNVGYNMDDNTQSNSHEIILGNQNQEPVVKNTPVKKEEPSDDFMSNNPDNVQGVN